MAHPARRLQVLAEVALPVDRDWYKCARDDVGATLRQGQTRPALPLGDCPGDAHRRRRGSDDLAADALVHADPGVERQSILAAPADVALDGIRDSGASR